MSQLSTASISLSGSPRITSSPLPCPPAPTRAAYNPQPAMILQRTHKAITSRPLLHVAAAASHSGAAAFKSSDFTPTGPAATHAPGSYSTSSEACAALWKGSHQPLLTLERSLPASAQADAKLWGSGGFSAEVYPDLPVAATWRGLLQNGIGR